MNFPHYCWPTIALVSFIHFFFEIMINNCVGRIVLMQSDRRKMHIGQRSLRKKIKVKSIKNLVSLERLSVLSKFYVSISNFSFVPSILMSTY